MLKKSILALLLVLLVLPVGAQRRRSRAPRVKVVPVVNIDSLISIYHFEEAGEELQKQIDAAESAGTPTDSLEKVAERVRTGLNMLNATAQITIVDSMVVKKSDMLSAIHLDSSCGSLNYWKNVFEGQGGAVAETTTYTNDFKDKLFYCYPDKNGRLKLYCRYKLGSQWSEPSALEGIENADFDEAYPYMLSDGMTLYFASTSEEGLGGYDIYITRYNTDTKRFLKAENMGMPFNSPANDYLLAIDEQTGVGFFVTDRNQPVGKVCIYQFIPEEQRNTYSYTEENADEIRALAQIHHISATQKNKTAVAEARSRYHQLVQGTRNPTAAQQTFSFVVYNGIIYHSLEDFKNPKAKQLAANWKEMTQKRASVLSDLTKSRRNFATDASMRGNIAKQEQALEQLDKAIADLEWNIRYEEQSKLGIKN